MIGRFEPDMKIGEGREGECVWGSVGERGVWGGVCVGEGSVSGGG